MILIADNNNNNKVIRGIDMTLAAIQTHEYSFHIEKYTTID